MEFKSQPWMLEAKQGDFWSSLLVDYPRQKHEFRCCAPPG